MSSSEWWLEVWLRRVTWFDAPGRLRPEGCVAPSSRGGRWLCRDALPTTSYPCRPASPDTPFRVRHDKRVLDPVKDAPSTVSAPALTGLPRVQPGVLARGTACATLSGPLRLLTLSPHSLVRPAPRTFFRPDHGASPVPRADLVKAGPQGHPSPTDLALTRSSTAPGWRYRARRSVSLMRRACF